LTTKFIFKAAVTGHSLDCQGPGYKSWDDHRKDGDFTFAASSFEDALVVCRELGKTLVVEIQGGHNNDYITASFVTIRQLTCDGMILV